MLTFQSLSTPQGDGETLIEPPAEELGGLVEQNRRRLAEIGDRRIHGRPLSDLRAVTRSMLAGQRGDGVVVVTGHQPSFYHAGVWAKNIVAARLAQALGGAAVNLIVDNDAPKKTTLVVPHHRDGMLSAQDVPFAEYRVGLAFEQYHALDPAAGVRLVGEIRRALGEQAYRDSAMPLMADALTDDTHAQDLVDQVTAARKAVERRFGLELIERRVSQVWAGPVLLDMLLNAERFFACYNGALADFRKELGLRGTERPVPDLVERQGRFELPVWVYRHSRPRRRLFVRRDDDTLTFYADDDDIGSVRAGDLTEGDAMSRLGAVLGWRFRPRALTLTFWARLLLGDLFIHGIGGAKYDRITDQLMRRYLDIDPPEMACASATVRMPMERFPVDTDDLIAARRKVRDVHYNPQRYLSAADDGVSERLKRRADAIAESDRLRADDPDNHEVRREVFHEIRRLNAELLSLDPGLADRMAEEVRRIERELAHNAVADYREYFFGLLPLSKLDRLADALPGVGDLGA